MNPASDIVPDDPLTKYLVTAALGAALNDELWAIFGYEGRPRRGRVLRRFVNQERLGREAFVYREAALLELGQHALSSFDVGRDGYNDPALVDAFWVVVDAQARLALEPNGFDAAEASIRDTANRWADYATAHTAAEPVNAWAGVLMSHTAEVFGPDPTIIANVSSLALAVTLNRASRAEAFRNALSGSRYY